MAKLFHVNTLVLSGVVFTSDIIVTTSRTGQFAPSGMTGQFITTAQTGQFAPSGMTGQFVSTSMTGTLVPAGITGNAFYPRFGNPSNFLTSSQAGGVNQIIVTGTSLSGSITFSGAANISVLTGYAGQNIVAISGWDTGQYVTNGMTGGLASAGLTGQFITTAQTGQFAPSGMTGQFVTTFQTGQFAPSGLTGQFITTAQTGHIHSQYLTGPYGVTSLLTTGFVWSGSAVTGITYSGNILISGGGNVSVFTGATSGFQSIIISGTTGNLVFQGMTGQFVDTAHTGGFVSISQTGQFLDSSMTGNFVTNGQTGTLVPAGITGNAFYPRFGNPSNFLTSVSPVGVTNINVSGITISGSITITGIAGIGVSLSGNAVLISGDANQTGQFVTSAQTGQFVDSSKTGQFITTAQTGQFAPSGMTGQFITTAQTGIFLTSVLPGGVTSLMATGFVWSGSAVTGIIYSGNILISGGGNVSVFTGATSGFQSIIVSGNTGNLVFQGMTGQFVDTAHTGGFVSISQTGQFVDSSKTGNFLTSVSLFGVNTLITSGISLSGNVTLTGIAGVGVSISGNTFIFSGVSNQTGQFVTSAQTGQFVDSSKTGQFITTAQTGQFAPSGMTGQFITTAQTGHVHSQYLTGPYGVTNLITTGFVWSGSAVTGITYSGSIIISGGGNVSVFTGATSGFQTIVVSGNTGNLVFQGMTGQFIDSSMTGTLVPAGITGNAFYPRFGNPSNFLTAAQAGGVQSVNITGQIISGALTMTGIGGTQVTISGNTIVVSGGTSSTSSVGGGVTGLGISGSSPLTGYIQLVGTSGILLTQGQNPNVIAVSFGSANSYLFNSGISSGVSLQFINFPVALGSNPTVLTSLNSNTGSPIIGSQTSGLVSTGFWITFANSIPDNSYNLNVFAATTTFTGLITSLTSNTYNTIVTGSINNIITGGVTSINLTGNLLSGSLNITGVAGNLVTASGATIVISGDCNQYPILNSPLDYPMALGVGPMIWNKQVQWLMPGNAGALTSGGCTPTNLGTITHTQDMQYGYLTNFASAAGPTVSAGTSFTTSNLFRGPSTLASGSRNGFFLSCRFVLPDATGSYITGLQGGGVNGQPSGVRIFVGVTDQTLALVLNSNVPTGQRIGLSFIRATGGGQGLQAARNDNTFQIITADNISQYSGDTSIAFNSGAFQFNIYMPPAPNNGGAFWRLDDYSRGIYSTGIVTGGLPNVGTPLRAAAGVFSLSGAKNIRTCGLYAEV